MRYPRERAYLSQEIGRNLNLSLAWPPGITPLVLQEVLIEELPRDPCLYVTIAVDLGPVLCDLFIPREERASWEILRFVPFGQMLRSETRLRRFENGLEPRFRGSGLLLFERRFDGCFGYLSLAAGAQHEDDVHGGLHARTSV